MNPASSLSPNRRFAAVCILIFFVALGLRLCGIGWGLKNDLHNQSYHPDETLIFDFVHRSHIVRPAGEAEYYNYGTLYYAILRAAETAGSIAGKPRPASLEPQDNLEHTKWDDLNTYVAQSEKWGRFASALAGALTAVLLFLIVRKWTTTLGALAAAALVVFSPAHVEHSRFQTVDIVSLFFVALATWACLRLLQRDSATTKNVLVAAALVGISASTRYTNILLIFSLFTALAVVRPKNWLGLCGLSGVVAAIAFAVTTPGSITDTQLFIANLKYQANITSTGQSLVFVGVPPGFIFHFEQLLIGIGYGSAVLGVLGLIYAAIRRHKTAWVLLAFFIPTYAFLSTQPVMFLRYGFPLYVGIACGFGYAISSIQRRWNNRWIAVGVAAVALVGIESSQSGLRGSLLFTKWMMETDPRDEAGEYMKSVSKSTPNVDIGILGDTPWFWSAAIIKDASFIKYQTPEVKAEYLAGTKDPHVTPFRPGGYPMYATYSSFEIEDAERLKGRLDIDPQYWGVVQLANSQVDALAGIYNTDKVFGGGGPTIHDLEYIRPTITILKRKDLP